MIFADLGYQCVVFAVLRGIFANSRTVVRTVCGLCMEVAWPKDQENHLM